MILGSWFAHTARYARDDSENDDSEAGTPCPRLSAPPRLGAIQMHKKTHPTRRLDGPRSLGCNAVSELVTQCLELLGRWVVVRGSEVDGVVFGFGRFALLLGVSDALLIEDAESSVE